MQEIKSGLNKKEIESDVDEEEKVIESLMNEDDGLKSSMEEEEDKKSEIKNKNEGSSSLIRPPSEDRRYSIIPNITSTSDYCIHCYSEFYEELELKE